MPWRSATSFHLHRAALLWSARRRGSDARCRWSAICPGSGADTAGFLLRLAREQGDVAVFRLGNREAFLLSHPDDVRQVLVDDAGAFRRENSCSARGGSWATVC